VPEVISAISRKLRPFTREELEALVSTNDKRRFAFSADGKRIRASQGHSVSVDLGLASAVPPLVLYHGTKASVVQQIRLEGLRPGKRQHVHLSADPVTARRVAARRSGASVILAVRSGEVQEHPFFLSANGVWLTEHVPPEYLDELPAADC